MARRRKREDGNKSAKRAFKKFLKKNQRQGKTLRNFYGLLPGTYGDGLEYQRMVRGEWEV